MRDVKFGFNLKLLNESFNDELAIFCALGVNNRFREAESHFYYWMIAVFFEICLWNESIVIHKSVVNIEKRMNEREKEQFMCWHFK